jgi:hypothetical protein
LCLSFRLGLERRRAGLAPSSINNIISTVSAFYEYLMLAGEWTIIENPILKVPDYARARVSDTHRPFMGYASPTTAGTTSNPS